MMPLHPAMVRQLVREHLTDELRDADESRLAATARGDRPGAVSRLARRVVPARAATPVVPAIVVAGPEHREALRAFLLELSPQTTYRRFVSTAPAADVVDLGLMLARDRCHRGFVAVVGDRIVGHAHAVAAPDRDSVELGVVIADDWQGRGLGRQLVGALLEAEPVASAAELEFFVLAANTASRGLVRAMWPGAAGEPEGELVHFRVATGRRADQPVTARTARAGCHA